MSIAEVARLAGVSTATVSRALSGRGHVSAAARERVVAAARELGYVVSQAASSLASGRTRNVGIVLPFLSRWYFTAVLEGAQQRLMRSGYDVTLYNLAGDGGERRTVFEHFLQRQRVDAVIAVSLELTEPEVTSLHALGKPLVGVGGPIPGVRTLAIDDVAVATLATEHLIGLGHSRIGLIGGDVESDADFHLPTKRRQGWEAAMREAGLPIAESRVANADFTVQGGYRAAKQLLGAPLRDRATAIFAASDEMAFGAMLAARDLGLSVPLDVSIVGVDDHDMSDFFGLTTIAQFPGAQGALAVDILMAQLEPKGDDTPPSDTPLPFELRVRSSTSRPRD
ncbi:LacI family DNA-binding transcriptional regulator [Microbacterium paludicola]|uniref:LacI family transcriptional regulator n=1 Tax=Microbacterium paludicola TaxID=300019 RepID=A0A4Y9FWN2_9MICO|nr:LacI family DNA-binding transcriptional regulator [Microbacterium paludicola]MBF0815961.1 LacI family DNA-binding transcriptional regulator [Microbacterium paludicola]TFU33427.1 LacI family transcriptional regulator [Microbacterium paludicola]